MINSDKYIYTGKYILNITNGQIVSNLSVGSKLIVYENKFIYQDYLKLTRIDPNNGWSCYVGINIPNRDWTIKNFNFKSLYLETVMNGTGTVWAYDVVTLFIVNNIAVKVFQDVPAAPKYSGMWGIPGRYHYGFGQLTFETRRWNKYVVKIENASGTLKYYLNITALDGSNAKYVFPQNNQNNIITKYQEFIIPKKYTSDLRV